MGYRFAGTRDHATTIEKGKETRLDLTVGLRVPVELRLPRRGRPGQLVRVRADVVTGSDVAGRGRCDAPRGRVRAGGAGGDPAGRAGEQTVDEVAAGFL